MEAARRAIAERFFPLPPPSPRWGEGSIERWTVFESAELCAGCAFLGGRVFFAFEGPRPGLHPYCRCARLPVETRGMSGVALIRLVLEARANGRAAHYLEEEAKRRRDEEWARRVVRELAERGDERFQRLAEAYAREDLRRGGR